VATMNTHESLARIPVHDGRSRKLNTAALGAGIVSAAAVSAFAPGVARASTFYYYYSGACCGHKHYNPYSTWKTHHNYAVLRWRYTGGKSEICVQEYVPNLGRSDLPTCASYGNGPHDNLNGASAYNDALCYKYSSWRSPLSCKVSYN
jgi:hypothetical protein